jgi:2,3-bisphosphoglycerate-independent phosphoglycerate mutase
MKTKKALLIIMDGWGWREDTDANAVRMARTPTVDALWETYPHTLIQGSGLFVGLPDGQMGNSEVGHLNLGAGRVVNQDIVRIDRAITDGSFFSNEALVGAMNAARERGGALHLVGLLSDGGVHSHQHHLHALVRMASQHGVSRVFVHAILDGRDTPPHNGARYLVLLRDALEGSGVGRIASVVGRYYCMDRDKRWQRTERAYDLMTLGTGTRTADPREAVEASYQDGITDEFVEPIVVTGEDGKPVAAINDGDAVIFFNFRADRARQITHALNDDDFGGFERKKRVNVHYVCMTHYEDAFDLPEAFPPEHRRNILAEVGAAAGKTTLRIAETEKYAHVTYFFNGGEEQVHEGETRILVPSPKVATYDLQPEMSAAGVASKLIEEIKADRHDYIICNFANPDMVGHTGVLEAAIKACETVDSCVARVLGAVDLDRTVVIVTADHGNCEQMVDYINGGPHTAHTTNPVPCVLVDPDYKGKLIEGGALKDIAPTILNYLGVPVPQEMTGDDLRADRK